MNERMALDLTDLVLDDSPSVAQAVWSTLAASTAA